MSFEAMAWAHAQKVPDSECKLILLMLANRSATHETDSNICWPSIGQIAEDCLLSETTIRQRLKTLKELGLVTWINRCGPDGNPTSHLFTLPVAPLRGANPLPRRAKGDTSPHAPPPTSPGEPETVSTETVIKPKGVLGEKRSTIQNSTVIPEELNVPEFRAAWVMWLEHLKQKRKSPSLHAQDLQLRKLADMGPTKATSTIRFCVEKNWQGIYEETNPAYSGTEAAKKQQEAEKWAKNFIR